MVRLDCYVTEDVKARLARALQKAGIAEVAFLDNEELEEAGIERSIPDACVDEVSRQILEVQRLIDFYSEYDTKDVGFIVDILGITQIEPSDTKRVSVEKLLEYSREVAGKIGESVADIVGRRAHLDKTADELEGKEKSLEAFRGLNPKVEWIGESEHLVVEAVLATPREFESLQAELAASLGDGFGLEHCTCGDGGVAAIVYAGIKDKEELERIIRKTGCERLAFSGEGRVNDILEEIGDELSRVKAGQSMLEEEIRASFNADYRRLLELKEQLSIEKKRCEVFIRCGQTEKTILMRLWIPLSRKEEAIALINRETSDVNLIEADENPADAPIILKNPPIIRSFEVLTKLFSPPRYGDIDPTPLIAPTFALFFGLMLTDAVYGILLAGAAYALMKKYGRYSKGLYDLCTILAVCGISAVLFGILTGSYLGDLVGKYVLGGVGSQSVALWKDPLYKTNSIIFLAAVCIAGFIHLFLGYFMGAYESLRRGDVKGALMNYGSWFMLACGAITVAAAGYGKIPAGAASIGYGLSLLGLGFLFAGSGLMAFLEIVGLVGNTLSYARLLALALTTAGIAMTFNFLAQISLKIPYIGLFVAAIVFIFGHVINILMNALGGFVHALRLHYVEFFGTFYPGGGREFEPFMEDRIYTKTGD
ncbi:MAG: V-type ATP synthase subunit I [Candidatus Altiarchaeota archaeon]